MSSAQSLGGNYWGTLIRPDKSPAPLLELLCLGIAQFMPTLDPSSGTPELTPEKLATFYRAVGGNYDTLFLHTKSHALSFIYQSLGCFHTLQPTTNPFEPPSIPALLPNGFVRWQTIQLLLCPDEHAQYLQNAVRQWDIPNPNGGVFPKMIPREAFPAKPDPEMVEWHEKVTRQLEREYQKRNTPRHSPPNLGIRDHHSRSGESPKSPEGDYFSQTHHRRMPCRRRSKTDASAEQLRRARLRRRNSAESPSPWSSRFDPDFGYPEVRLDGTRIASSEPHSPSLRSGHSSKSKHRRRLSLSDDEDNFGLDDAYVSDASSEGSFRPRRRRSIDDERRHGRHRHRSPPKAVRARRHSHDAAYTRMHRKDISPHRSAPGDDGYERDAYTASIKRDRDYYVPQQHKTSKLYYSGSLKAPKSGVKIREYTFSDPVSPMHVSSTGSPDPLHPYLRYAGEYYLPKHPSHLDSCPPDEKRRVSHGSGSANGNRSGSGGSGNERSWSLSSAGGSRAQRWASAAGIMTIKR